MLFAALSVYGQDPDCIVLNNDHVEIKFRNSNHAYTLSEISRADGSDKLAFTSSEFEILLLNNEVINFSSTGFKHF